MIFPVTVSCGYPSYEAAGTEWEDLDYRAWNLVKAIKGKPMNGHALFGNLTVDGTPGGRMNAMRLAASDAVRRLTELGLSAPLVPVPASDHIEFEGDFTGRRIAAAIESANQQFLNRPVLKFDQVLTKASQGGTRDPAILANHLELNPGTEFTQCILVDDVVTTGGHLKAAARKLAQSGIEVVGAYCVAKTVQDRPEHLFRIPNETLDANPEWWEQG